MASNPVPTMTSKGWLTEPNEKAAHLLAWFMMAGPDQSNTFAGNISSMTELILKYGKSPQALCDHTKIVIEGLFGRYFDSVDATVTEIALPGETLDNGRYQIKLSVTAIEQNVRINVFEDLHVGNNTFTRVKDLINSGGEHEY